MRNAERVAGTDLGISRTLTVAERVRARVERARRARLTDWGGADPLRSRCPAPGDIALTSNDYLALGSDPWIVDARRTTGDDPGAAAALEAGLAAHLGAPAAVLCQSGWAANTGLMQSIADPTIPVHLDRRAHMSLTHGARAAGAPVHFFPHNDLAALRARIAAFGPGIIAVDAMDSAWGGRADLEQLCAVAEGTGGLLVVDESHTLGVDGPAGAGAVVGLGLTDRVAFRTASLAKAFAGRAGVIAAGDPDFADYFRLASAPAVFSSAVPGHEAAALRAALALVRGAGARRDRLRNTGDVVRKGLRDMGFDLGGAAGQIVSLSTGPGRRALGVRDYLADRGITGSLFFPPAVPGQGTLLRFSLHAALSGDQLAHLLAACAAVADTFGPTPPDPTAS
ncbi:aminotransferase class I/II-fold pyridoxal phosphate-dependent enzyme [Nocardia rhizosphaerae]|uniref:8-amino-7-oxononanoate synthase n=1 Tax=Nocardia rhizosphaerae TaxID=1691571 RepID=A0ABV8LBG9_9NOCA